MHEYSKLGSEYEIKQKLFEMGVDLYPAETRWERNIAKEFQAFSSFILHEEAEKCLEILDSSTSDSVGELQGGNDNYSIYRVSFPEDEDSDDNDGFNCNNVALKLLNEFNQRNQSISQPLKAEEIKQYLLGMCDRRSSDRGTRKYTSLGNLMFILQFGGPTLGQVRHIDNMLPNLQICCYMSSDCPSTVVYDIDDGGEAPVTNGKLLIEFWERNDYIVPDLVKTILHEKANTNLKSKWYTKFFKFWGTLDSHLNCFGKLYQPVALQLSLQTQPGTTLLAGGNEVHAGPASEGPRMFVFAIGIPKDGVCSELISNESVDDEEENSSIGNNDGEVQYSPVLLHIDFCCLLFGILDCEYLHSTNKKAKRGSIEIIEKLVIDAKRFLLEILLVLIADYPMKGYLRQIPDERMEVRNWLESVLSCLDNDIELRHLVEKAVGSDSIFYSPDINNRRSKKKKRRGKIN